MTLPGAMTTQSDNDDSLRHDGGHGRDVVDEGVAGHIVGAHVASRAQPVRAVLRPHESRRLVHHPEQVIGQRAHTGREELVVEDEILIVIRATVVPGVDLRPGGRVRCQAVGDQVALQGGGSGGADARLRRRRRRQCCAATGVRAVALQCGKRVSTVCASRRGDCYSSGHALTIHSSTDCGVMYSLYSCGERERSRRRRRREGMGPDGQWEAPFGQMKRRKRQLGR